MRCSKWGWHYYDYQPKFVPDEAIEITIRENANQSLGRLCRLFGKRSHRPYGG